MVRGVTAALKLGLELTARTPTHLTLGTFFETWISLVDGTVKRSLGRDEYHLALTVDRGRRLAGTGRTHICQLDSEACELGQNQATPAHLVPANISRGIPVFLGLRTNAFLDLASLRAGAAFRLITDPGDAVDFTLEHPAIAPELIGPGRFLIELGGLVT